MKTKPPDGHQLAVAILAIATAAIGFGIFGGDFALGELVQKPGLARQIQWAKLTGIVATTVFYFLVLITVGRMLPSHRISGRELLNGPIAWLYLEMVSLAGLYFFGVLEELFAD